MAVVKAGLCNVGEALFKLARCHQDQRTAVVALHHILLHLQLLFAKAGQLPLLLLLLTDGAHPSRLARNLGLALVEGNALPGHHVHIFEMAAQVPGLREGLLALGAGEGALARVLAEVVPKVAALLENRAAAAMPTPEIQLHAHRFVVAHLDRLVPITRDSLEGLGFGANGCSLLSALNLVRQNLVLLCLTLQVLAKFENRLWDLLRDARP